MNARDEKIQFIDMMLTDTFDIVPRELRTWTPTCVIIEALNMDDIPMTKHSIAKYLGQIMEMKEVYRDRRLYNGKYVNGYCGVTRKPGA